jgi:hypothetical protein
VQCAFAPNRIETAEHLSKQARKNAQGMITEPGNMVIYVAGYPAIMGLQPLYFRDSELARRARIPAEGAQTKKLGDMLANASV